MILRRARPRSSVERDYDPPSSETTILRRAATLVDVILVTVVVDAVISYLDFLGYKQFSHLPRPLRLKRLHPGVEHVWLLVARHTSTSRHPFLPLKHLPENPAFITFLGLFGTVIIAETTASNCICATWIRAVS